MNLLALSVQRLRRGIFLGVVMGVATLWAAPPLQPDQSRWRLGPFFESMSEAGTNTFFAIRPFYAREYSLAHDTRDLDVVWPISHSERMGEYSHGRVVMTFGIDTNIHDPDASWSFAIPPIWFQGKTREQDRYWGFFPIYGRMPRLLFVEDVNWTLFPFYLSYRTGGSLAVRRRYFLWPFISMKEDSDRTRWAFWPIYGTKRETDFDSRFVLWPFWNSQTFHSDVKKGSAWMLWPLYQHIDADTEKGFGVLPPFFFYSKTTQGACLLRCPWPFFERYTDYHESTWRSWRFWGMTTRGSRSGWWFLHPLVVHSEQKTDNVDIKMTRVWPLYINESQQVSNMAKQWRCTESYFRIWPFYSDSYQEETGRRQRMFELLPVRAWPTIERNLAPFWVLYQVDTPPGSRMKYHELFWGLIQWTTEVEEESHDLND